MRDIIQRFGKVADNHVGKLINVLRWQQLIKIPITRRTPGISAGIPLFLKTSRLLKMSRKYPTACEARNIKLVVL